MVLNKLTISKAYFSMCIYDHSFWIFIPAPVTNGNTPVITPRATPPIFDEAEKVGIITT